MKYLSVFIFLAGLLLPASSSSQGLTSIVDVLGDDRAFLGVYSGNMSEEKAEILGFDTPYGSYVTRVIPNSAAEKAGLRPFDYIFGIDDRRVSRADDLTDLLENYEPGDPVTVHFIRQGKRQTVRATLGERSSPSYFRRETAEDAFFGISPHDENEKEELGVRIEVIRHSTADELGVQDGDLILEINDHPMVDWSDISAAIDNLQSGEMIRVAFEREGRKRTVSGEIRSREYAQSNSRVWSSSGEKAFLGIVSSQLSNDKAERLGFDNAYGGYVTQVIEGTAARQAGIEPFDYLYGIDEYRTGEHQSLGQIIQKYNPGEEATLYLIRKGKRVTLPVTFSRKSNARERSRDQCAEPFLGVRHVHKSGELDGVTVTIVPNSTARVIGLEDGDEITSINGFPILDWEDVSTAINNLKVGETITVSYRREGRIRQGSAAIKSHCDTKQKSGNDYDYEYEYDDQTWGTPRSAPRRNAANFKVEMNAITASEAEEIRRTHDIDMPSDQSLRIEGLNLFPNPTNGLFNLQFNLPERGETGIRIFNASGRQIYNYELGNFSGEFSDEVDISQNGTGTYFLQIRQGKRSVAKKVILNGT